MSFEPLTYRPELPLRWHERVMAALGIPFERRRGDPVPFMVDRDHTNHAIYFLDPKRGPMRIGGGR